MALRYLLTSNFPRSGNDEVARLLSDARVFGPVAWMAPEPDAERFACAEAEFAQLGLGPLVDISSVGAAAIVGVAAVYLSGGNPLAFRDRLRETGVAAWLRLNLASATPLPVIAASGGAMQLTRNLSVFRLLSFPLEQVLGERDAFAGLGLVDCEVIPHFDQHPAPLLDAARDYSMRVGRPVFGLPDGSAVAVIGSTISGVGAVLSLRPEGE